MPAGFLCAVNTLARGTALRQAPGDLLVKGQAVSEVVSILVPLASKMYH